jgi:microcystin-dependent protein
MTEMIDALIEGTCFMLPVGTIQMYAHFDHEVPSGWLLCDGTLFQTAEYPELFSVIGFAFGGDAHTGFNVPDFRAKSPLGENPDIGGDDDYSIRDLGDIGGEESHSLTVDELPAHQHEIWETAKYRAFTTGAGGGVGWSGAGVTNTYKTGLIGGDDPHNIMHPFLTVQFIIYAGIP